MSSSKPAVRRTYGKLPTRTPSSSSLFDDPPSPVFASSSRRSSSPPSSSRLDTPPASPPTPAKLFSAPSSPLFLPAEFDDEEENVPPLSKAGGSDATKGPKDMVKVVKRARSSPKKAVQSSLKGFFAPLPTRKRPLEPTTTLPSISRSSKKALVKVSIGGQSTSTPKLTQLHLTHLPLLHTCQECGMSYMRGGEDDGVHAVHHSRVLRGITWDGLGKGKGRSKDQGSTDVGWKVIKDDIGFAGGKGRGRVIMVDASWGGSKLDEILATVDTVLSSPPLPTPILDKCKVFLFLTSSAPPPSTKRQRLEPVKSVQKQRERVVSVVVAQGIKWAMKVVDDETEQTDGGKSKMVESGGSGSVRCDPQPLPTPLGIHRLYTSPSYRSHGLSYHLLDGARYHTVYGCSFDPSKGEVAFSQPTQSGREVMRRWGRGGVRVFVDDESQL